MGLLSACHGRWREEAFGTDVLVFMGGSGASRNGVWRLAFVLEFEVRAENGARAVCYKVCGNVFICVFVSAKYCGYLLNEYMQVYKNM